MDKDEDQALVSRCLKGDRAAFTVLVHRYQRPIYNAAYRVVGNAEDARDIAQEVFMKVASHLGEYDPKRKFFSWIYRIAINESLNLSRKLGREEPLDEAHDPAAGEHANPEWQLGQAQASRDIQAALMRLPFDDRVVVTLRHFSDCSYLEIGNILGIEEKTVKSRLFEARQKLRGLLADYQPR